MKKTMTLLAGISFSAISFGQVGINTETPKATLDIVATPADATIIDGLLAPRLEGSELQSKNALYGADQTGTIVYAKSASPQAGTPGDKTINVDAAGYYYFDGTVWTKMGGGSGIEPWHVQNTTNQAENNTDNIYQKGKVAIGFESTDAVSEKQFEVKGDMKAEFVDADGYVYNFATAVPNAHDPNTKEILTSVANNEDLAAATHYSVLGNNKNNVMFYTRDFTTSNQKVAVITASNLLNGGLVAMGSGATQGGLNVEFSGSTWTGDAIARIRADQEVDSKEITMEIGVRPKTGITFHHSANIDAEENYNDYTFPTNAPEVGQVLVGSSTYLGTTHGRRLEWKDLQDVVILKSPGGNCFKITVDDAGNLSTTPVTCL